MSGHVLPAGDVALTLGRALHSAFVFQPRHVIKSRFSLVDCLSPASAATTATECVGTVLEVTAYAAHAHLSHAVGDADNTAHAARPREGFGGRSEERRVGKEC